VEENRMKTFLSILYNLCVAFDQALNCCFRLDGEWGAPDETLSARAWRVREKHPKWHVWINRMFFWDVTNGKSHCEAAYENVLLRHYMPNHYRDSIE
jgi:hypothetical protein